jgi:hypothetical protein
VETTPVCSARHVWPLKTEGSKATTEANQL